ncbi:MAG: hypothetical protein IIA49_10670, partial [Bacteroidetes bacterium]|nr:hypothetical protein [Bacteroidota bacterium]
MIEEDIDKNKAIIVFARFPVKGKVKTRLAKEVEIDFATSFYKVCAGYTFAEVLETENDGVTAFLFCSEEYEIEQMKNWTGNKFKYYSQQG